MLTYSLNNGRHIPLFAIGTHSKSFEVKDNQRYDTKQKRWMFYSLMVFKKATGWESNRTRQDTKENEGSEAAFFIYFTNKNE
ncbi:hypothetical protein BKP57_02080 [Virgibacillus sp. 6R]|uniref:Uncharacterized protein n=1 Tax=Virgibacillus pantothenticus TaxID=1473 RepID=A0A0L0QQ02_VIRPA|nr:hypothetical protein BKP57_02080 [Virgibacillus sp. 6R]KNE20700.1 hypothetical protein AFK71_20405 [Virgibacillus pantothenticus]